MERGSPVSRGWHTEPGGTNHFPGAAALPCQLPVEELGAAPILLFKMEASEGNKARTVVTIERPPPLAEVSTALSSGVLGPLPLQNEVWIHFFRLSSTGWAAMKGSQPCISCASSVVFTGRGSVCVHVFERGKG